MLNWKLIAICLAIWLAVKFYGVGDFHRHECPNCGHLWAHFRSNITNMQAAHTCPQCGAAQPRRYVGLKFPVGQKLYYGK